MQKAKKFQDLVVWQKAHEFVLKIYKMTESFPKSELFGLTSQIRRSSVSIPANIVEGFKRAGLKEKARFFNIAQSSLDETYYYLILIQDLEYFNTRDMKNDLDEIAKILNAYCKTLRQKEKSPNS